MGDVFHDGLFNQTIDRGLAAWKNSELVMQKAHQHRAGRLFKQMHSRKVFNPTPLLQR
jgi:hypothetical protein